MANLGEIRGGLEVEYTKMFIQVDALARWIEFRFGHLYGRIYQILLAADWPTNTGQLEWMSDKDLHEILNTEQETGKPSS